MLTRKQAELLRFIHERLKEAGVPPSFDEMKDALDLRSKSGIHRLITALEERGFIRRLPNRARAIEVIKLPESIAHGIVVGPLARLHAERDRRQSRPRAHGVRGRRRPPGRRAGDGPHRRRHADRGHPDPQPYHQHAARSSHHGRAFRARSARRFDDRGRHSRRRHGAPQTHRRRRHRRHRRRADRRRGSHAQAVPPPRRLDRARTGQYRLRGAHPAAQPRAHPGQARRAVPRY